MIIIVTIQCFAILFLFYIVYTLQKELIKVQKEIIEINKNKITSFEIEIDTKFEIDLQVQTLPDA